MRVTFGWLLITYSNFKDLRAFIFGWLVLVLWFHLSTRYRKLLYLTNTSYGILSFGWLMVFLIHRLIAARDRCY